MFHLGRNQERWKDRWKTVGNQGKTGRRCGHVMRIEIFRKLAVIKDGAYVRDGNLTWVA